MPIHDWSKAPPKLFHNFHHGWIETIKDYLNEHLPGNYYALAEQWSEERFYPDILTLHAPDADESMGGVATLEKPCRTRTHLHSGELESYTRRKSHIAVRDEETLVAIVEIVSAGNKASEVAFDQLIAKCSFMLNNGVHILLIDLHRPTSRDPQGIHGAVWKRLFDREYHRPVKKPLTFVSYEVNGSVGAYVVPAASGDDSPKMPLFLKPGACINIPLEEMYWKKWLAQPALFRSKVELPAKGKRKSA